ncbi:MAG: hypothetical protein BJ554DRAFT_5665, partial [Olpidium bornovanus]
AREVHSAQVSKETRRSKLRQALCARVKSEEGSWHPARAGHPRTQAPSWRIRAFPREASALPVALLGPWPPPPITRDSADATSHYSRVKQALNKVRYERSKILLAPATSPETASSAVPPCPLRTPAPLFAISPPARRPIPAAACWRGVRHVRGCGEPVLRGPRAGCPVPRCEPSAQKPARFCPAGSGRACEHGGPPPRRLWPGGCRCQKSEPDRCHLPSPVGGFARRQDSAELLTPTLPFSDGVQVHLASFASQPREGACRFNIETFAEEGGSRHIRPCRGPLILHGRCARARSGRYPKIIIDSGATDHMLTSPAGFTGSRQEDIPIEVADGQTVHAVAPADISLTTPSGLMTLERAPHVRDLAVSLFSISRACDHHATVFFTKDSATIRDEITGPVLATGAREDNLYILDLAASDLPSHTGAYTRAARLIASLSVWHQRLAHLNYSPLRKLASASKFCAFPSRRRLTQTQPLTAKLVTKGKLLKLATP